MHASAKKFIENKSNTKSLKSIETNFNSQHKNITDIRNNQPIFLVKKEIFDYENCDVWSKDSSIIETYNGDEEKTLISKFKDYSLACGLAVVSFSAFVIKTIK